MSSCVSSLFPCWRADPILSSLVFFAVFLPCQDGSNEYTLPRFIHVIIVFLFENMRQTQEQKKWKQIAERRGRLRVTVPLIWPTLSLFFFCPPTAVLLIATGNDPPTRRCRINIFVGDGGRGGENPFKKVPPFDWFLFVRVWNWHANQHLVVNWESFDFSPVRCSVMCLPPVGIHSTLIRLADRSVQCAAQWRSVFSAWQVTVATEPKERTLLLPGFFLTFFLLVLPLFLCYSQCENTKLSHSVWEFQ